MNARTAILLMGPTSSGKSDLAIALAQRLPLEIISVDSAMVYRGLDIGTAKPEPEVRRQVIHHLVDIRDVTETYSAGEFVQDAARLMEDIWARGASPLLVGGTMLYFHALTHGIAALPGRDERVRAVIEARAAARGWAAVHAELAAVDPAAAARIHPNDPQRIQRAWEVFELTGEPISRLQAMRLSAFADAQVVEFAISAKDRADLHHRIEGRFMRMLEAGLLDEVRLCFQRTGLRAEHPSMRAVGYRQLWNHLAGHSTLAQATAEAIAATRQLAKRQLSWLRRRADATWLDPTRCDATSAVLSALTKCGVV